MIMVLMIALRGKVDRVVSPWPSFSMYRGISSICGLTFEAIGLGSDGLPDERALDEALADERALVMLCVPNNPTGDSMEEFVRSKVPTSKAYIAIDQAYAEFCGSDMSDMASGRTVILRTFSKARRIAGIRVGYSISGEEMVGLLKKAKLPYNVPSICEEIAISALDEEEALGEYVGDNSFGRDYLTQGLMKMGLKVRGDSCNFLLVELDGDAGCRLNEKLASMGILTRAFADRPDLIRVTVGTASENRRLIDAVRVALKTNESEKADVLGILYECEKAAEIEKKAGWD
jgi:histidinol-phosphate aminotransferase